MGLINFAFKQNKSALTQISEQEYNDIFNKLSEQQLQQAYNTAWSAKNAESDAYWKRANYSWAFQVASFAGYFSVLSSKFYFINPEILYFIICIGVVTSVSWVLINKGSKTWQRHWEIHIDLLEEKINGPLYKIVTTKKTFSVSKINEIVSIYFAFIWISLGIKFLIENVTLTFSSWENVYYSILICTFSVLYFVSAMFFGYGRGQFGKREVQLFKRDYLVKNSTVENDTKS